jgi:hypothetical protein
VALKQLSKVLRTIFVTAQLRLSAPFPKMRRVVEVEIGVVMKATAVAEMVAVGTTIVMVLEGEEAVMEEVGTVMEDHLGVGTVMVEDMGAEVDMDTQNLSHTITVVILLAEDTVDEMKCLEATLLSRMATRKTMDVLPFQTTITLLSLVHILAMAAVVPQDTLWSTAVHLVAAPAMGTLPLPHTQTSIHTCTPVAQLLVVNHILRAEVLRAELPAPITLTKVKRKEAEEHPDNLVQCKTFNNPFLSNHPSTRLVRLCSTLNGTTSEFISHHQFNEWTAC